MLDVEAFGAVVAKIVADEVERATAPLIARIDELEARAPERGEPGERGADGCDGADGQAGRDGVDGQNGADGQPGRDGVDGKIGPAGRDGADGVPGRDGTDGERGANGKDGAPGVGLAGALIDRVGSLVVTLSDGTTRELGPVIGRDGTDGAAGRDGVDGSAGAAGRDGRDGRDGVDGLGFDDLSVEQNGEREFVLRFARGEQAKTFAFAMPVLIDRGVYRAGNAYQKGDCVSFGGSLWIAQGDTETKPDGPDTGWRLAVKRGRDGKDAGQR